MPPTRSAPNARRTAVRALVRGAAAGRRSARGRRAPGRARRSSTSACTQSTCRSRPRSWRSCDGPALVEADQREVHRGDLPAARRPATARCGPRRRRGRAARPGGRSASSASTNWFGVADQTRSLAAYLSSQARASMRPRLDRAQASGSSEQCRSAGRRRRRAPRPCRGRGPRRSAGPAPAGAGRRAGSRPARPRGTPSASGSTVMFAAPASACSASVSTFPNTMSGLARRRLLEGRRELAARAAPVRPEVHEDDVVVRHGLLECLGGELGRCHSVFPHLWMGSSPA